MVHPLRAFRKRNNEMSQEELAKLLGCSRITIIRWETGARRVAPDLLPKIQKLTGISARDLRPDLAEMLERA